MAIEQTAAGVIVSVVTRNQDGSKNPAVPYVFYCNAAQMVNCNAIDGNVSQDAFILGIFQNIVQVLLILTKNKLYYGRTCVIQPPEGGGVADVVLKGVFLSGGLADKAAFISYATLPFVYLCDNSLGDGPNKAMPIYTYNSMPQNFTQAGLIVLNKVSGNFGIVADTSGPALNNLTQAMVSAETLAAMVKVYNAQFLDAGYPGGKTLIAELRDNFAAITAGHGIEAVGAGKAFGQVLIDIARRWLDLTTDKKPTFDDYNIGAGLYLTDSTTSHTKYYTLVKSLNKKSVNRAAHAEVRISLLLDFLDAVFSSTLTDFNTTALPDSCNDPLMLYRLACDLHKFTSSIDDRDAEQLVLFSSMLPCYLCEGTIESTEGGQITKINKMDVGLWSAFLNVVSYSARIANTFYYDIDAAIDYRTINVVWSGQYDNIAVLRFTGIDLSSFIPSNIVMSSAFGTGVPLTSLSIYNCGEKSPLVGVQNDETATRYQLSGSIMSMYVGRSGTQNIR